MVGLHFYKENAITTSVITDSHSHLMFFKKEHFKRREHDIASLIQIITSIKDNLKFQQTASYKRQATLVFAI